VAVIPYRANALVRHSNPLTPRWLLPPALWITARLGNSLARSEKPNRQKRTGVSRWVRKARSDGEREVDNHADGVTV
jgi:hypothetical protein